MIWVRILMMISLWVAWGWYLSQFTRLHRLEEACERAWFALNGELLGRHSLALKAVAAAGASTPEGQVLSEEVVAVVQACTARAGWVGDAERMENEVRLTERLSRLVADGAASCDSGEGAVLSALSEDILHSEERIREALEAHNQAVTALNAAVQARTSGIVARKTEMQARPPLPRVC